jgi:ubiquinone/menaquinone biosynthesis C-methylase UbiE
MPYKEKELLVDAFSDMAPDYERKVNAELNLFWGWSYSGFIGELMARTPIHLNDTVLDVATGTGVITDHIVRNGLTLNHVHALDLTYSMLKHAKTRFKASKTEGRTDPVCASAMEMPYNGNAFSVVLCGLATHHMDVDKFVGESHRVLMSNGRLSIIDAGGSPWWKIPGIKLFIRCAAYIYFLFKENPMRAWAESDAVSNVRAKEEWHGILSAAGFRDIEITKLTSRNSFIPSPLLIKAVKRQGEAS